MQHECTTVTASAINEPRNKKGNSMRRNGARSSSFAYFEVNKIRNFQLREKHFVRISTDSLMRETKPKWSVDSLPPQAVINSPSISVSIDFSFFALFSNRAQFFLLCSLAAANSVCSNDIGCDTFSSIEHLYSVWLRRRKKLLKTHFLLRQLILEAISLPSSARRADVEIEGREESYSIFAEIY